MTDRLTDRRMDKVITIGPLPFLSGGALIVSVTSSYLDL